MSNTIRICLIAIVAAVAASTLVPPANATAASVAFSEESRVFIFLTDRGARSPSPVIVVAYDGAYKAATDNKTSCTLNGRLSSARNAALWREIADLSEDTTKGFASPTQLNASTAPIPDYRATRISIRVYRPDYALFADPRSDIGSHILEIIAPLIKSCG